MIKYTFKYSARDELSFQVEERSDVSMEVLPDPLPGWLLLSSHRCPDCTILPESRQTCPAAVSLKPVIEAFSAHTSHEPVELVVESGDVRTTARTTTQRALRSLIGLMLPFSSCPIMLRLRPMAHLHLPMGGRAHTAFRFLGMHLVAQVLRQLEGQPADWELTQLVELLRKIRAVNRKLVQRVRAATEDDAAVNSLIILDAIADSVELGIETSLERLRPLFAGYLSR